MPSAARRSSAGVSAPPPYAPTRSARSVSIVTSSRFEPRSAPGCRPAFARVRPHAAAAHAAVSITASRPWWKSARPARHRAIGHRGSETQRKPKDSLWLCVSVARSVRVSQPVGRLLPRAARRLVAAAWVAALWLCAAGISTAAGRSAIADAVMKGDKAALRTLLQQKVDVNAPQVDGATALHWAVYRDDLDAADLLIRAGANVKAANREGVTPLAMAALYGNAPMIAKLLKAGAEATETGPNGQTVLMMAARNGNPNAVKLLLEAGAKVNARETLRGTTALMWAVEQKHQAAVKVLLDGGADFRARTAGAGLPRNYIAQRVNNAIVQAAQRRFAAAAAAGPAYEGQPEFQQGSRVE